MSNQNNSYNNESITSLKGADRVRLRPGVIFGSDGIEGCQHSVFEIISSLSSSVCRERQLLLGVKYDLGLFLNVTTKDFKLFFLANSAAVDKIALCARCTPSKKPSATE